MEEYTFDIDNVFEELDKINTNEEIITDLDSRLLASMGQAWFTSRCYHDLIDPSETRYELVQGNKAAYHEREYAYSRVKDRLKVLLVKVLASYNRNALTSTDCGIQPQDTIRMAKACLLALL